MLLRACVRSDTDTDELLARIPVDFSLGRPGTATAAPQAASSQQQPPPRVGSGVMHPDVPVGRLMRRGERAGQANAEDDWVYDISRREQGGVGAAAAVRPQHPILQAQAQAPVPALPDGAGPPPLQAELAAARELEAALGHFQRLGVHGDRGLDVDGGVRVERVELRGPPQGAGGAGLAFRNALPPPQQDFVLTYLD